MRAFDFYREKSSAVSSLVDSRRTVRTHATYLIRKRFLQANFGVRKRALSVGLELAKSALRYGIAFRHILAPPPHSGNVAAVSLDVFPVPY